MHNNGGKACWWELEVVARHVHPSMASMPRTLLLGGNVNHTCDPLRDFILGSFKINLLGRIPRLAIRRKMQATCLNNDHPNQNGNIR